MQPWPKPPKVLGWVSSRMTSGKAVVNGSSLHIVGLHGSWLDRLLDSQATVPAKYQTLFRNVCCFSKHDEHRRGDYHWWKFVLNRVVWLASTARLCVRRRCCHANGEQHFGVG